MRNFTTKLLSVFVVLGVASAANAGFHLEPFLGTSLSGGWEQGNSSGDYSTTNFGTRLGYQSPMGFQVGGEIQLGTGSVESGTASNNTGLADFGAYFGYQSAMGFRGYFTYMFTSALVIDSGLIDPAYTGSGFKIGGGYSVLPWLAFNLEYHMMTYDEVDVGTLTEDLKTDAVMLVVSFPFDFGGR